MTAPVTPGAGLGTIVRQPVADWLQAIVATATGWPCGFCEAPRDPNTGDTAGLPYTVLWPIPGGTMSGPPLAAPEADGELIFQIDSVGTDAAQVTQLADRARAGILGRQDGGYVYGPDPVGFHAPFRSSMDGEGAMPTMAGTAANPVWSTSERFEIYVCTSDIPGGQ